MQISWSAQLQPANSFYASISSPYAPCMGLFTYIFTSNHSRRNVGKYSLHGASGKALETEFCGKHMFTKSFKYQKHAILGLGFPLHKPYPYSFYRFSYLYVGLITTTSLTGGGPVGPLQVALLGMFLRSSATKIFQKIRSIFEQELVVSRNQAQHDVFLLVL